MCGDRACTLQGRLPNRIFLRHEAPFNPTIDGIKAMKTLLFTPLNLVLLAAATVAAYVLVPESLQLPIHWGPSGAADVFWPRNAALIIAPAIASAVWLLLALVAVVSSRIVCAVAGYACWPP